MKKIGIGIIGLGGIGERLIQVFNKHPRTNIVGIYDVDAVRMAYIAKTYHLKSVHAYASLLNNNEIDMIYIAVPPEYHHELALKAFSAHKHVLCEKPLANSIKEAQEMWAVASKSDCIHAINFPLYFGAAYGEIKRIINMGQLGKVKRIELSAQFPVWPRPWQENNWINTKDQGGFVREIFTHFIQLMEALFGKIEIMTSYVDYSYGSDLGESSLLAIGEIDEAVKVVFKGLTGVNQTENIKMTIYGDQSTLELINWRALYINNLEKGRIKVTLDAHDATYKLIDEFYKAIDGKKSDRVTFFEGLNVTTVVEHLLKR